MADDQITPQVYLCPRCLTPAEEPGTCPDCNVERVGCRPGDPDDPCRKPLMTRDGKVKARAPLWWLKRTVTRLTELLEAPER